MVGKLLLRGMIAGLIAGILAFAFAYTFGEPEIVSRAVQSTIGLATGLLVYGAAIGGIFALVFAYAYGRATRLGARASAALLAVAAFIAVVVVPQVKYPPTPPAVGSPETIAERTSLFFIMLALSIAAMVLAVVLARRLWATRGPWAAGIIAAIAWLVVVVVIQLALPAINEVPADFSADSLWRFRLASLGIHAVLWAGIGLIFGALAEPLLEERAPRRYALA